MEAAKIMIKTILFAHSLKDTATGKGARMGAVAVATLKKIDLYQQKVLLSRGKRDRLYTYQKRGEKVRKCVQYKICKVC